MSIKNNTNIKNKIGLFLILLSQITPIFSLIIPFFGFPDNIEYILIALTFVGGKHVILLMGFALVGKKGLLLLRQKVLSILGIPEEKHSATKFQYNLALFIILYWFISVFIVGYFPEINEISFIKNYHFWIVLFSDLLFIIAIFFIGGHQMITKIVKLFTWESWELPLKHQNKK